MRWPWKGEAPEPASSWSDVPDEKRVGSRNGSPSAGSRSEDFDEIEQRARDLEEELRASINEAEAKLANLEEERRRILRELKQAREHGDSQREEHAEWEHYQVIERKETWYQHLAGQKKLLHEHLHRKDIVRVRELEGQINQALEKVERVVQRIAPQLATQDDAGAGRERIRRNQRRLEPQARPSTIEEVPEAERERNEAAIEEGLASLGEEGRS